MCVLIWKIPPSLNGHWIYYIAARQLGYENVGIVIQAYLYRSEEDLRKLLGDCFKIRLCKGAYTEPAKIAYPKMKDIDANYDRCAALLIDASLAKECPRVSADGKIPPDPRFGDP